MRTDTAASLAGLSARDAWLHDAGDEFLTPEFLSLAANLAVPDGWTPLFLTVSDAEGIALLLPLMRARGRLAALTTPYTCLWAPLFRPGLPAHAALQAAHAAGQFVRRCAVTRLDALDGGSQALAHLRRGFADAGLITRDYAHFGTWTGCVGGFSEAAYFGARPGPLRTTLRRKERRAADGGLTVRVLTGPEAVAGVADYEAVAARSWKSVEPFPAFLRSWMEGASRDGTGRIGLLCQSGNPVAAQFWTLRHGRARVHKLVHDEAVAAFSPGTVLTAAMCRLMLSVGASILDFGRGDDPYKASWVSDRTQRSGLLIVAPWRPRGAATLLQHDAGLFRRRRSLVLSGECRPGEQDP